jgi:Tfp pilus assembly protein PilN
MSSVNLLPAYARPAHPWAAIGKDVSPHRVLKIGAAVALLVVLALALGYVHERSVVNDRRSTLADVQTQVAATDAKAAPLRAAQTAAAAPMAAATTVSSGRVAWESVLADLSRVLPRRVQLQSLTVGAPTAFASGASTTAPTTGASTPTTTAAPATPSAFAATGVASSHVRVALVLDRLARLPWLSDVALVSSTNGSAGTSGSLSAGDTFSVTGSFNPNGGAK